MLQPRYPLQSPCLNNSFCFGLTVTTNKTIKRVSSISVGRVVKQCNQIQFFTMQKELPETTSQRVIKVRKESNDFRHPFSTRMVKFEDKEDPQLFDVEKCLDGISVDEQTEFKSQKGEKNIEDMDESCLSDRQLRSQVEVVRAGYLHKDTDSFFGSWKTYYCQLSLHKMMCFTDETRTKLICSINFKKVSCQIKVRDDQMETFDLICGDQAMAHSFKSKSIEETQLWTRDIFSVVKSFINQPKLKIRKGSQEVYHNEDTLTEQEFFQIAQSGDILLMKTDDSKCALQRLVTNSQYDHIGMVLKFPNGSVKIFEANADEGVQLYEWSDFHLKFTHYRKVCYRKLYHPRKEEVHALLIPFMKKMIGKSYSFGAMKLLRKKSDNDGIECQNEYFCSELMAKAYKNLGLLDKTRGSNTYWPIDFTDRGALIMQNESYLGFERLVILKRHMRMFQ